MKKCGIYCILDTANDRRYVGQSVDVSARRVVHFSKLRSGSHPNAYLQSSFNEYGADSFEFRILEEVPEDMLDVRECSWISFYNSDSREFGYNLSPGGHKHKHLSEQHRQKISRRLKESAAAKEHRKKLVSAQIGRKLSLATRAKIAKSHEGIRPSDEVRLKMSEAKLNDSVAIEHCRELARQRVGKPLSRQHRDNMSLAQAKRRRLEQAQR